jgi:hypothetical protein
MVLINVNQVGAIRSLADGTEIMFIGGGAIRMSEQPEEILKYADLEAYTKPDSGGPGGAVAMAKSRRP